MFENIKWKGFDLFLVDKLIGFDFYFGCCLFNKVRDILWIDMNVIVGCLNVGIGGNKMVMFNNDLFDGVFIVFVNVNNW